MRRRPVRLVLLAASVGVMSTLTIAPVAGPETRPAAASPVDRRPPPPTPPRHQVAEEVDLTTVVPALEEAFGARYGGFWIEPDHERDRLHVAVVDATPDDAALVAQLTGGHPQVVTDPVDYSYAELRAAQDEIVQTLDRSSGDFTVSAEVASNSVVVRTASEDPAAVSAPAEDAARRGVAEEQAGLDAGPELAAPAVPDAGGGEAADPTPAPEVAPESTRDVAGAVVVEQDASIDLEPTVDRWNWDAYGPGLSVTTWDGWSAYQCTSGFIFHHWAYGYFASTAGHCGTPGAWTAVGGRWFDAIRVNRYHGVGWVAADVGLFSLSAHGVPAWPMVRANWIVGLNAKFLNSQIGRGLWLCFEGVGSVWGRCGTVVRSNEWMCCDSAGHAYFYSCINYPSAPGDSGGPVYHRYPSGAAVAAGMVSSSVVLDGQRVMCFTMVESMQNDLGMQVVTY